MKLADLQAMGAMAPDKLIKREVKIERPVLLPKEQWADPDVEEESGDYESDTLTVYIRQGSAADAIEMMGAARREQPFVVIHRAICHEDGTPVFESLEQAMRLKLWLAFPLFDAIKEVAPKAPKASRKKRSGGTNSP